MQGQQAPQGFFKTKRQVIGHEGLSTIQRGGLRGRFF